MSMIGQTIAHYTITERLGQAQATRKMVEDILFTDAGLPPTVVDADGLNSLASSGDAPWWERFPSRAIVTPHAGEMGRLAGTSADAIQRNSSPLSGSPHEDLRGPTFESFGRLGGARPTWALSNLFRTRSRSRRSHTDCPGRSG